MACYEGHWYEPDYTDYGFEYSEDSNSEPDVDLENQYYNSKALKEDEPKAALTSFQRVLDLEGGDKGEWGFKALKQMIKINFKLSNFDEMMARYKQLLTYIKSAVTRNHSEKSINSILDYISTSKNMELLQDFYETTLEALKDAKNDRLWFKTNTKLGKLYYDRKDFTKLAKILKQLHQSCQTDDGEDDLKKGTQLLEIYALEIQMYTEQKNNKKLKTLYEQSLHIKSAIPHPLIMGVIRECGGKMHLREGEFEKAHTDFFEAFKNYDESGSPRRTTCLKYLVLANMLMKSGINPFDSQEAKPYKNDPEILAMTNLVNAYQTNDINEFEAILKQNRQNIMDDPFIREHIEDLLRNIRTQVLIKLINPYTRIYIPHISTELNIDVTEVENLLVSCILDKFSQPHVYIPSLTDEPIARTIWTQHFSWANFHHQKLRDFGLGIEYSVTVIDMKNYSPLMILLSEVNLMRTVFRLMRGNALAREKMNWKEECPNPFNIIIRYRSYFNLQDRFPLFIEQRRVLQFPTTLTFFVKAFRHLYNIDEMHFLLADINGLREVPLQGFLETNQIHDHFMIKTKSTSKNVYDFLYLPYIANDLLTICHFVDVYETDMVFNPQNFQIVVWAKTQYRFIEPPLYRQIVELLRLSQGIQL